ncbi:Universal stress protein family 3 [Marinobacterium lacunae]|uniref:Universal stress protein family 3 n=1 Tax=Marinobacterium lacunae TaxID=1232683 RepID=A0A081G193_9GAMM|nr:universal stress protein [Marinobacterium lacunae]KEA64548.1 Universal stress protein family 3 [Marinobacterium lacunae]MBR9884618.1 universal stress protein [Oceanospirillales bacterium]
MYKTILVPVDLAEEGFCDEVVRHALEVLAPKGKLILLTVVAGYQMPLVGSYFPPGTFDKAIKEVHQQLKAFVEQKLPIDPEDCTLEVKEGKPADLILSEAKRLKADLIVMASHKRSRLERSVLGSVATKVVGRSTTPVLVIKG